MLLTIIKCEMCENHFRYNTLQRPYERDIPAGWLTLVEGNPQVTEGSHFCSHACLIAWVAGPSGGAEPLLSAGDFEDLNRGQKNAVQALYATMTQSFNELRDHFLLQYPELELDWRFQLEPRFRKEQKA